MADITPTPQQPVEPLPARELEGDASSRGIRSDEAVEGDGTDTHLPASESNFIKRDHHRAAERNPTQPPPD